MMLKIREIREIVGSTFLVQPKDEISEYCKTHSFYHLVQPEAQNIKTLQNSRKL